jgi:hypothetical protein
MRWRWIIRGFCLYLCALCVTAWGGSYWCGVGVQSAGMNWVRFAMARGRAVLCHEGSEFPPLTGWEFESFPPMFKDETDMDRQANFLFLGFSYARPPGYRWVTVPLWFPTLLSGMLLWLVWRQTRRRHDGPGFPVEAATKCAKM